MTFFSKLFTYGSWVLILVAIRRHKKQGINDGFIDVIMWEFQKDGDSSSSWWKEIARMHALLLDEFYRYLSTQRVNEHIISESARAISRIVRQSKSKVFALIDSSMDMFFNYATPFCCGLQGTINSLLIPSFLQKETSSFEVYSPPLLDLKISIFLPAKFSTLTLNSLNLSKTYPQSSRDISTYYERSHQ